jgi:CHAT domain
VPQTAPIKIFHVTVCTDGIIRVKREQGSEGDVRNCTVKVDDLQRRTIQVLDTMLREGRLAGKEEFKVLGANLYRILFENQLGEVVDKALRQPVQFLRVELEFEKGQEALSSLPWEYTYFPEEYGGGGGYFLGERVKLCLTRRLCLDTSRDLRIDEGPPLKVLFVASSPIGFKVEYEKFLEVFGSRPDLIKVTPLLPYHPDDTEKTIPKATWGNFTAMLGNEQFHAIHFLGHGRWNAQAKAGTILFMKKDGTADPIDDEFMANRLMDCDDLRLVFLQACESAQSDPYRAFSGVAQQLAQKGIPAVVGMQYKIHHRVANRFAEAFYEALALAETVTVDVAVQKARRKIADEFSDSIERLGFGLPVLYLRESDSMFAPGASTGGQEKTPLSTPVVPDTAVASPTLPSAATTTGGDNFAVAPPPPLVPVPPPPSMPVPPTPNPESKYPA